MLLNTIDCIIPCYNEQKALPFLTEKLRQLRESSRNEADLRFIFVDDGSTDSTFNILKKFATDENNVSIIRFSRNFGHQIAVTAGVDASSGDYVAILDADMQDPPELIIDMLKKAQGGFDVVYGKRLKRQKETVFKLVTARLFYRLINFLCDIEIPADTGDFRLISRRVANAFKAMPERRRFVRGMIPWIGFPSAPLEYTREPRVAGKTNYTYIKMIRFAIDGILSFSSKPIHFATVLGGILALSGLIGLLYIFYIKLTTNSVLPGFTTILATIILFGGMQISLTGMIGAYIARVFDESKSRPLYIIRDKIRG